MKGYLLVLDAASVLCTARHIWAQLDRHTDWGSVEELDRAARLLRAAQWRANAAAVRLERRAATLRQRAA